VLDLRGLPAIPKELYLNPNKYPASARKAITLIKKAVSFESLPMARA
jgi:hypothetical protein